MCDLQARIHTGFHRFTEIGHIFHTKYIFNNKKHFPSWNPVWMTRKPWKGDFKKSKSTETSWGNPPPEPARSLRLRRSFRKSVSIYPRSAPDLDSMKRIWSKYCCRKWVTKLSFCHPENLSLIFLIISVRRTSLLSWKYLLVEEEEFFCSLTVSKFLYAGSFANAKKVDVSEFQVKN